MVFLAAVGCSRSKQPRQVGGNLPVVASGSVALPDATDAADAPHSPSVAESRDASLTAYRDSATGVSFRYPAAWRPAIGTTLPAPAFRDVAGPARITQQFTPERTALAQTVLRGLSFSYTVKNGSDQASCAAIPTRASAGGTSAREVNYGGVSFSEVSGGDAAMCTHVETVVDATLRGDQCLVFERDMVTTCPYVKSATLPRPLTTEETRALQGELEAVMRSVEIAPR